MDFSTLDLTSFVTTANAIVPVAMSVIVPVLGLKFGIRFLVSLVSGL